MRVSSSAVDLRATRSDFEVLSDYDMRHEVTHLIGALRSDPGNACDEERRDRWMWALLRLLAMPGYPLAKAARFGADAVIVDYVAAEGIVGGERPEAVAELSRGLATATILDASGEAPTLVPEALHAVLGYGANTTMYADVLTLVTDGDLIERLVSDAARRDWLMRAFLHAAATMSRRRGGPGNLDAARVLLTKASTAAAGVDAGSPETRDELGLRSSVLYDLAYIDFLTGNSRSAEAGFRESAEMARQAGDSVKRYISGALERIVALYAETARPTAVRAYLRVAVEQFTAMGARSPHARRWVMNGRSHLLDLACLLGDADEADMQLRLLERDPWVAAFRPFDRFYTWRARHCVAFGEYERARVLYAEMLADELRLEEDSCVREGASRDLLEYGSALAALDERTLARAVWHRGLRYPDHAANWPWKEQIVRRLATVDDEED